MSRSTMVATVVALLFATSSASTPVRRMKIMERFRLGSRAIRKSLLAL